MVLAGRNNQMKTTFTNWEIFNGGQNEIGVSINKKWYHVYKDEKGFRIYYNNSRVYVTIPESVHHLVEIART